MKWSSGKVVIEDCELKSDAETKTNSEQPQNDYILIIL